MKKTREFHDNESKIISGESELLCRCGIVYKVQSILMPLSLHGGAALIRGRRLLTFLSQMRRLFNGGAYSSKYGIVNGGSAQYTSYRMKERLVLCDESFISFRGSRNRKQPVWVIHSTFHSEKL